MTSTAWNLLAEAETLIEPKPVRVALGNGGTRQANPQEKELAQIKALIAIGVSLADLVDSYQRVSIAKGDIGG